VHVEEDDPDLEVVEMDDLQDVPFEFALPRDRVVDFAEGVDDDISLSDTPGSDGQEGPALRSARLDFPAVMTQAAECVCLPLPAHRIWQCVEAIWRRPLKAKASIESMFGHYQGAGPIRHGVSWRAPPR